MAQKKSTAKKTPKKKTGASDAKQAKGSSKSTAKKTQSPHSRNPFYMLIILSLITVIVILLNNYYKVPESKKEAVEKEQLITPEELREEKIPEEEVKEPESAGDSHEEKAQAQTIPVKVYFIRLNENTETFYLSPVKREVIKENFLEEAVRALAKGPSAYEEKRGYLSAVPKDLQIRNIRVRNRTAYVDFNSAIERDAAGNILINRLDQIVYTATQFPGIDNIVVTIDGRHRSSLGSDGLSISGPLHRR